ncbi:hypothetical protein BGW80DRAFT_1448258 [Lactifluus volemus]|nr:hypothetical protein BGW80DRAFT_1448258 [Lactifluus volemus]
MSQRGRTNSLEDGVAESTSTGRNVDDRQTAQNAQNETPQEHFSDGSGPIFNMYVKMAKEEDNKLAHSWQKDADGILIFTGLFSAAVAVLVAVSILDLKPDPHETSNFYLKNIYQLLADPNISRASILAEPPPFSPPVYAIWVNSLWFLSLAISLQCALLATLLQQWARRYVANTQPPHYSPHKQARVRAFFADGIEKLRLPNAVEALPAMLHLSLFLFFSGLLVFLLNINRSVFHVVVGWVGLSAGVYGCVTLMPIFRRDSPYYAPLSSSVWYLCTGVSYCIFRILTFITSSDDSYFEYATWEHFKELMEAYRKRLSQGMVKTAQETASELSEKLDGGVISWLFDALEEDHELEQFFKGIPGFSSSNTEVVTNPKQVMANLGNPRLAAALATFLNHTWSSSSLSEKFEERRLNLCMQAINALDHQHLPLDFLFELCKQSTDGAFLQSIQLGHLLRSWAHSTDPQTASCTQGIIAGIIASVPNRDSSQWKALVMDQLGISEDVLQDYLAHGDSVLLANWIHITRQWYRSHRLWWWSPALELIQPTISKFDVQGSLPALQSNFCTLWNDITREAREDEARQIHSHILKPVRRIYVALHKGTNAAPTRFFHSTSDLSHVLSDPSSYPICDIPGPHSHINIHAADQTNIVDSSHLSPPVNVGNKHLVSASYNLATAQGSPDIPVISPSVNAEPDPRSALEASISIPQFTLPSSSTVTPQHADFGAVPPSTVPGASLSSVPATGSSSVLPTEPRSSVTSLTAQPVILVSQPDRSPDDAAFGIHENSRTPESSGGGPVIPVPVPP